MQDEKMTFLELLEKVNKEKVYPKLIEVDGYIYELDYENTENYHDYIEQEHEVPYSNILIYISETFTISGLLSSKSFRVFY